MKKASLLSIFTLFTIISCHAQWNVIQRFPSGQSDGAFSFTVNNMGYVGGGVTSTSMYALDPMTDQWVKKKSIPSPGPVLGWAFAVTHNGKAYVGGGSFNTASDLTQNFYEYDPTTDSWTAKANLAAGKRDGMFAFVLGDKLYAGGGFEGTSILNDFNVYDFATDKWASLQNLPFGSVLFASSFVVSGKAFVIGGDQGTGELNHLWQYDASNDSWVDKGAFPGEPRQDAIAFVVGNEVYFGGGQSGYVKTFNNIWHYDLSTNTWGQSSSKFPSQKPAWSTAFVIGNNVYSGLGAGFQGSSIVFTDSFYKADFSSVADIHNSSETSFLKIYPNPVSSLLEIDGIENNSEIVIYDVTGKEVHRECLLLNHINLSNLTNGLYFLKVNNMESIRLMPLLKM